MPCSAIHARNAVTIASASSPTSLRSISLCPAARMRSASTSPDVSVSRVRLSETVRTAMLTGSSGRLGSVAAMFGDLDRAARAVVARPAAGGQRVERRRGLPQAMPVDPQIGENVLDEGTGLAGRDRLDEHQRIGRLCVAL